MENPQIAKLLESPCLKQFINWLNTEYGISGMRENASIVSLLMVGGNACGESAEKDDIDIEVVFNDPKLANFDNAKKIQDFASSLNSKFDIHIKLKEEFDKLFFKTVGSAKYMPKTLLLIELYTAVTIAGEDFIAKFKQRPDVIPKEEAYGIMYSAMADFYEGKYAKSAIKAGYALFSINNDGVLKIKDGKVYRTMVELAKTYVGLADAKFLDRAYKAKLGEGEIEKAEAEDFLNKVNAALLQRT